MDASRRTLLILCLASAGWAFSFGLGATLASPWLTAAGCGNTLIGLNTSIYYLGVAVASIALPWVLRKAGRNCIVLGMVADALTTALFPWGGNAAGWFLLRLLGGAATALSIIPMETLVNHNAPPERRARDFGLYAFCVALGIGLGPVVGMPVYAVAPRGAFLLGGLVALASAALAWWGLPAKDVSDTEDVGNAPLSVAANALTFGTAWIQGFLEGGMITFLSVYLLGLKYTETHVGLLIGVLFLGVLTFQVPGAWLADHVGRLRVLLACHAVVFAGMVGLLFCTGPIGLTVLLFSIGACCAALYPLGLALLGERLPKAAQGKANAWYLASNCVGSLSGPVVMGLVLEWWGWSSLFATGALAVLMMVGVASAWERCQRGKHISMAEITDRKKAA